MIQMVLSVGALLVYVAVSHWAKRSPSQQVQSALHRGAAFGAPLAIAALISHTLEVFAALQSPMPAILGVGMWGLRFLLLGLASTGTCRHQESMVLGIVSSVWGSLIFAAATVVFALTVGLLFMSRMERDMVGAFTVSGMTDAPAFVVRNMLDGASSHLLMAPVVAVATGSASSVSYFLLKSVSRRTAMTLAIGATVALVGGVGALRFASSLERSERPPFVMLGLISFGLALASAGPVFAVIRDANKTCQPRSIHS
jgi:hypothetical protein